MVNGFRSIAPVMEKKRLLYLFIILLALSHGSSRRGCPEISGCLSKNAGISLRPRLDFHELVFMLGGYSGYGGFDLTSALSPAGRYSAHGLGSRRLPSYPKTPSSSI